MGLPKTIVFFLLIATTDEVPMNTKLEDVPCNEKAQALCRTDVPGNNCTRNHQFNQHVCSCDFSKGFTLYLHTDWRGYVHRCVRSECTTEEMSYCLTSSGNDCKVLAENQIRCICKQGYVPEEGQLKEVQGCRQKDCYSHENSARCQTHFAGNRCNDDTDGNYHCVCEEHGYLITTDGKACFNTKCEDPLDRTACRTSVTGNNCSIVDGRYRQCICTAPRFEVRVDVNTNNTECWVTECTTEEKAFCDPFEEGNECVISDGVNFECKCNAPGSIMLTEFGRKRCFSTLCRAREDIYACKSEIDDNTCSLHNGTVRKCTCGASGYEVDPLNEETCWRTACVSYEQQQCHTQAAGNLCKVVADVHTCECNAPGFAAEADTSFPQRCIKKQKQTKSRRAKLRTNPTDKMLDISVVTTKGIPPEDGAEETDTCEEATELPTEQLAEV